MAFVFRAEDVRLQRRVALKVMRPGLAACNSERRRFLREARAAAAIQNDHVATVLDVGETNGIIWLAMPLLVGETLQQRLDRDHRLPQEDVIRIGKELASGLQAAHAKGLIHRDIKPDNIWLEGHEARVKILDFGLVCPAGIEAELTRDGSIPGTPRYMAPEQASTMPVDHRCDLFSLGSVLYRAVTGHSPFSGKTGMECIAAMMTESEKPAHCVADRVSREFSGLISRLLAKNPDDRPQSAFEVQNQLAHIGNGNGIGSWKSTFSSFRRAAVGLLLIAVILTLKYTGGGETRIDVSAPDGKVSELMIDISSSREIESIAITGEDPSDAVSSVAAESELTSRQKVLNVLAAGGQCIVVDQSGNEIACVEEQNIPVEPFDIVEVHVRDNPAFDVEVLRQLELIEELRCLDFWGSNVTDADMVQILAFSQLSRLEFSGAAISDQGMIGIEKLTSLRKLTLRSTRVGDTTLTRLAQLPHLEYLDIAHTDISLEGLREASQSLSLSNLGIGGPVIDNKALEIVGDMELRSLGLIFPSVADDHGIEHLVKISELRSLDLTGINVTDAGMAHVSRFPVLDQLFLRDTRITDACISDLANMSALRRLIINHGDLTDSAITELRERLPDCTVFVEGVPQDLSGLTAE
ncbi:MAG: protein kinase [Planctomycetaceae bacterium]